MLLLAKLRICASSFFNFFAFSVSSRFIKTKCNGFEFRNSLIQKLCVLEADILGALYCGLLSRNN